MKKIVLVLISLTITLIGEGPSMAALMSREIQKTVSETYVTCDYCDKELVSEHISIERRGFVATRIPCPDGMVGCLVLHYGKSEVTTLSTLQSFCDMYCLGNFANIATKETKE